MTVRPFAAAITATIPAGDPHSQARMEWCKDAVDAIAQVCLEHGTEAAGPPTLSDIAFACDGLRSAFAHGMGFLRQKAEENR